MDRNLLEFWGNMFLTAAKGQKQTEDMSKAMKNGFYNFGDMKDVFNSLSGIDLFTRTSSEYLKIFKKASDDFQTSLKDFLSLMDLVPRKEYVALREEYEAYKKATEEKSKGKIDKMLDEELSLQTEGLRSFEELMRTQTKQFQDLMSNFTKLLSQTQAPVPAAEPVKEPEEKKPAAQAKKRASPSTGKGTPRNREAKK